VDARYKPIVAGLGAAGLVLAALGDLVLGLALALPPLLAVLAIDQRSHNVAWRAAREDLRVQGPWLDAAERADAIVALERRFGGQLSPAMRALRGDLDISDAALGAARNRAVDRDEANLPPLRVNRRFLLLVFAVFPGGPALVALVIGLIARPQTGEQFIPVAVPAMIVPVYLAFAYCDSRRASSNSRVGWALAAGTTAIVWVSVVGGLVTS
jgi:hypothetical protein